MTRFLVQAAGGYGLTPWAFPEMVMALRMKREMSADRTEKESLRRLSTALVVVGEAKYGIYFNEEEESDRIQRGLLLRCLHKSKLAKEG